MYNFVESFMMAHVCSFLKGFHVLEKNVFSHFVMYILCVAIPLSLQIVQILCTGAKFCLLEQLIFLKII